MVDYPSGLPGPTDGKLTQKSIQSYADDEAQVGAPRRRKRFTRTLREFSFSSTFTSTQKDTFETFYYTTIDGGVTEFNWTHPDTSVVYEVRFVGDPVISHTTVDVWEASMVLGEI